MIYSEAYFNKGIDGQNNVLLNHMKKILMEVKWFKTKINSLEVKLHNMQHSYIWLLLSKGLLSIYLFLGIAENGSVLYIYSCRMN